jgi:hypothetical protein
MTCGVDELDRGHGVEAVHRVVAADRHERDVDLVAAARDQLQVAEQRGVAEVVDERVADVMSRPAGVCACPSA